MENSIANKFPQLAQEWAPEGNGDWTPENTSYGSTRKVTWRCAKGHQWQTTPNTRTRGGSVRPCPFCAGRKVIPGENDLATLYPAIAQEWATDLNENLNPQEILPGSDRKVWWRCAQRHEWQSRVNIRTLSDTQCPVCSNNMVYLDDYNITVYPEILEMWDAERNQHIEPEEVYISSHQDFWWICRRIHRWKTSPSAIFKAYRMHLLRHSDGETFGCKICARENSAGRELLPRFAELYPGLLAEWDWQKNSKAGLEPYELTLGSDVKAWWLCTAHQHSWYIAVRTRTRGSGCPYCANKKVLPGFNDLQTRMPELAAFWHPTLNGELKPSDIIATSHKKVHWLCANGHHSVGSPSAKSMVKVNVLSCKECFEQNRSRSSSLNPLD